MLGWLVSPRDRSPSKFVQFSTIGFLPVVGSSKPRSGQTYLERVDLAAATVDSLRLPNAGTWIASATGLPMLVLVACNRFRIRFGFLNAQDERSV